MRAGTRTIDGQSGKSRTLHMTQVIEKYGAPGGTRTLDLLVRSQTLYPTELRAHATKHSNTNTYAATLFNGICSESEAALDEPLLLSMPNK